MLIILTHAEVFHLALLFNERVLQNVPGVSIDVRTMRLRLLRAALDDAERMYEFSNDQLRVLDTLLTDSDPRGSKLPDGKPVEELVKKVWRAMIGETGVAASGETGVSDGRDASGSGDAHNDKRPSADESATVH